MKNELIVNERIADIMNRLEVTGINDLAKMDFDAEEVGKSILAELPNVENIVVTDKNYKDVKNSTLKTLKDTGKQLDEIRKKPKRIFKKLNDEYDSKMRAIEDAVSAETETLEAVIDEFVEQKRAEKIKFAESVKEEVTKELEERFNTVVIKPQYGNESMAKKAIKKDLKDQTEICMMNQRNFYNYRDAVLDIIREYNGKLINKIPENAYDRYIHDAVLDLIPLKDILDACRCDAETRVNYEKQVKEEMAMEAEKDAERAKEDAVETNEQPDTVTEPERDPIPQDGDNSFTEEVIRLSGRKKDIEAVKRYAERMLVDVEELL